MNKFTASLLFGLLFSISPVYADGIDSYAKVVLHCDGSDLGTTFTDSSSAPKTFTASGSAVTSTSVKKFGTASALTLSGKVTATSDSDFAFGTGDFTVDFWMNPSSVAADQCIIGTASLAGETGGWCLRMNGANMLGKVEHATAKFDVAHGMSTGTWYHVALVRSGSTLYFFVDGSQVTSVGSVSDDVTEEDAFYIGNRAGNDKNYTGYLDEVRISKGIARWTGNFTPPTAEYSVASGPAGIKTYNGIAKASIKTVNGTDIASVKTWNGIS